MSWRSAPRRRLTIRQHLVLFAVVLASPLLATLAYALAAERSNSAASADAAAQQLAGLAAAGVGQFVDQSRLLMIGASHDPIAVAGKGRCSLELRDLPSLRPEFASVTVFSSSGEPTCSVPRARLPLRSAAGRRWFQQVRRSGRFTVDTQVLDPMSGRRLALFALPWREGSATRGYLAVGVDLLRFQQPFGRLALPRGALVGIVDDRAVVQARSLRPRAAIGKRYDPIPHGRARTITAHGRDGVRRIYAASPVPGTRWLAYAGLPTAAALSASDDLVETVLLVAAFGLVLATMAAIVVSRRVTRPVRRLGAAAARVAAGDSDARADVDGPAEIAAAAAEFNSMVEKAEGAEEARRTALQRLAQAEKMEAVGRLAGGVAHDFNNVLLVIRGYAELALRERDREGRDDPNLREVLKAADRATSLTQQLLVFGRRQPTQPEPVDLGEVVDDMQTMLRRMIGEDVELVWSRPDEPVVTVADRAQLEQIVANLAINARDAMAGGGRLTIEVSLVDIEGGSSHDPGRYALLAVTDTGCGIDPDTATRIFEPFFSTKGEKGTGLGLATVHAIVAQSGGEVLVYSEPGSGTTFRVYLPAHGEPATAPPDGAHEDKPRPRASGTILLVEDDARVRSVVARMLRETGFEVLTADGAEAAATLARDHHGAVSLLITDLVMPGLSGPQAAELIRSTQPNLKVLYMSGYADDPVYRSGGAIDGSAGFIQKPFGAAELLGKIDRLLAGEDGR